MRETNCKYCLTRLHNPTWNAFVLHKHQLGFQHSVSATLHERFKPQMRYGNLRAHAAGGVVRGGGAGGCLTRA